MRPVRFVQAHDGTSLAWTRSGRGPPLVKASNWLTHLEFDAESPVWSHWISFLESHFDYLRYDERGCGLSDRQPGTLDLETWVDDLGRVVEAAEMPRPFALLAMSQGAATAVAFAARHPEQVSHLVLCGGYARGVARRGDDEAAALYQAIVDVFRMGWHLPNPAFREVFTKRYIPDGSPEKIAWFNELCRRTTTPEVGAALLEARARLDATPELARVRTPTLVLHPERDTVVPLSEGALLARAIDGAAFAVLDSANHILQADEPAWAEFQARLLEFTGASTPQGFADLTPREREILSLIGEAQSNKAIARQLGTSEKTVRNHATRVFAKLGVDSRQEAMLLVQRRRG